MRMVLVSGEQKLISFIRAAVISRKNYARASKVL